MNQSLDCWAAPRTACSHSMSCENSRKRSRRRSGRGEACLAPTMARPNSQGGRMPVGVFFDGFSSTAEMLEVCREAELAGASSLWFAQHMGYREAMVSAAAAASVTQRATLVPTAIRTYL